jgi:rubrerythrin
MKEILQTCIEVEDRVGEIYRQLVTHPDANEELREIWQEMAADEARHAERIRQVGARFEKAGVVVCNLTREGVQELLDRASEILQQAQDGRLSLEEAIYTSVELEDTFMAAHLGFAASGNQPDLQTMFKALAEADREHTVRLKSYLNRLHDGAGLVFGDEGKTP